MELLETPEGALDHGRFMQSPCLPREHSGDLKDTTHLGSAGRTLVGGQEGEQKWGVTEMEFTEVGEAHIHTHVHARTHACTPWYLQEPAHPGTSILPLLT